MYSPTIGKFNIILIHKQFAKITLFSLDNSLSLQ